MAETWFDLSEGDKRELLLVAADRLGRAPALIEKDIWVVWTLRWLFASEWRDHLVFKGGTSLSKVYRVIDRFSEDIDVTYDIRRLLPGLADAEPDPVPKSRSQADKWTKEARSTLAQWVQGPVLAAIAPDARSFNADVRCEGPDLILEYPSAIEAPELYMRPGVKIEFGGRATGEPVESARVGCDAAAVPGADDLLPITVVRAMALRRTFWEKATAAHVYCLDGRMRGERYARHWFDLACMHRMGHAAQASADREVARAVAVHKSWFFPEKATDRSSIDYGHCVAGGLQLVPAGDARQRLNDDHEAMASGGFLGAWRPDFDEVMALCVEIEAMANQGAA